jgi:neutral ceramidase
LTVAALALKYGDITAMIVSATIATFDNDKSWVIRKLISENTGVPADNIILCATHTHSAPETSSIPGWSEINLAYYTGILEPAIIKTAVQSLQSLKPVRMGIGSTRSDVGVNRRQLNKDGTISLGQNPWGPYDPCLTVVRFIAEDGPVANLIHYSAHATAAGYSREITRDWPGLMADRLEQQAGGITIFLNGAIGDTGPRLSNGQTTANMELMRELGCKAAMDAVCAYRTIKEYRSVEMDLITDKIRFPYAPLPPLELAQKALEQYPEPDKLTGMRKAEYVHWRNIIGEYAGGKEQETHFQFRQTILRLGPLVIIPFPNEMFVEISLRLRSYSPYQYTLCLSNANGSYAYFPSQDQICRGGYEIEAVKLCNTYILADDADQAAIDENLRLLDSLKAREEL